MKLRFHKDESLFWRVFTIVKSNENSRRSDWFSMNGEFSFCYTLLRCSDEECGVEILYQRNEVLLRIENFVVTLFKKVSRIRTSTICRKSFYRIITFLIWPYRSVVIFLFELSTLFLDCIYEIWVLWREVAAFNLEKIIGESPSSTILLLTINSIQSYRKHIRQAACAIEYVRLAFSLLTSFECLCRSTYCKNWKRERKWKSKYSNFI